MVDGLQYAVLYGLFLSFVAIGPIFFLLLEISITKGFRSALAFDLGAIFADIIFIIFAYYSTSGLIEKIKDDPNLIIFGGLILCAYGVISYIKTSKSFRKIVREHYSVDTRKNLFGLFVKGFFLNFINFGVLAGWIVAIATASKITGDTKYGLFIFITTILVTLLVMDISKIMLAKKLKSKMTPRFIFKAKKWVSIIIIVFGIIMIIKGGYSRIL
ncbi:threonine/homoserine/homoserine lactone efflux protein [Kordia periserrulae]|uniref:Threonine/homoserine/homoserine lactone efflux protein n=1 Tax=Kordia periserrulae TaxID=701523 RepID=A0A2T6BWP1_9FLAO|nr:LysE family transporter [Kordia periserrulae]PTX60495.1 threonine/homoserine/homoserine lactone efflux protein [Kordia periserrulae]